MVKDKSIKLDIKNQARVHIWYYQKYGIKKEAYSSVYDAISRWSSTVTCVGIRQVNNKFKIYSPYGLNDIFNMIIRPVYKDMTKEMYDERCKKWCNKWPKIKIISWKGDYNEGIDNGS